ncbi:unnamed protein product [Tetraodon nigroviridis]|uniref:Chromosome 8 SCAF15044, whole genome shotgun sequence n=1 Tax=Tetraodon nigroviridis TaxID=99883 RepID=Q4RIA7_TETNG|nr:unnamed protein product [Tetraodon nigroviridis]
MGGLLVGRNRKNSATELGRNGPSSGGTVWESLTSGKGRKNSKIDTGTLGREPSGEELQSGASVHQPDDQGGQTGQDPQI